ncbi:hypothetical protein AB0B41_30150, partial [Pseudonocardia sp. NPDC049154]
RRRSPAHRPVVTLAAAVLACAAALAGTLHGLAPTVGLPGALVADAALAAWAGTGAAGLLAVGAGLRRDRPLLRRIGLAFALLAASHAVRASAAAVVVPVALTLAATAALLAAAVPFLFSAVRGLWEQREAYRVEAERLRAALRSAGPDTRAPAVAEVVALAAAVDERRRTTRGPLRLVAAPPPRSEPSPAPEGAPGKVSRG